MCGQLKCKEFNTFYYSYPTWPPLVFASVPSLESTVFLSFRFYQSILWIFINTLSAIFSVRRLALHIKYVARSELSCDDDSTMYEDVVDARLFQLLRIKCRVRVVLSCAGLIVKTQSATISDRHLYSAINFIPEQRFLLFVFPPRIRTRTKLYNLTCTYNLRLLHDDHHNST